MYCIRDGCGTWTIHVLSSYFIDLSEERYQQMNIAHVLYVTHKLTQFTRPFLISDILANRTLKGISY